ncbi:MAG: glycosyltransferase family 2 protein [Clostridiales bacterium]|nr:glycosyltransferase family 2 protein [Clostridiales bacterium]
MRNRVSVLVTFYNQEDYVDKAIESILSQKTDFGVKIIVGDDGSTDRTCEKVNDWIGRYPDSIELHVMPDADVRIPGFRASRNRINLLGFVDTDYFIYLDGDDYFCFDKKLQRQVDVLDSEANSDCVACGHNTMMVFKNGDEKSFTDPEPGEGKTDSKEYWKKYHFHTDALLFRSSVIQHIDLKLLENSFNDNMITFPAILLGKIYYIPESWAVYLQTADGIWTTGDNLINYIRNIIFYDLSCKMAPGMRTQSLCKFGYVWQGLYRIRNRIDSAELSSYLKEAEDKGCPNASKWIRYRELNVFGKLSLMIKTFAVRCTMPLLRRL